METTRTRTLTEFLLACFAEDAADAETAAGLKSKTPFARDDYGRLLVQPARVLAECQAKRRIVERLAAVWAVARTADDVDLEGTIEIAEWTLKTLALPYADHPDYDPDWRP